MISLTMWILEIGGPNTKPEPSQEGGIGKSKQKSKNQNQNLDRNLTNLSQQRKRRLIVNLLV